MGDSTAGVAIGYCREWQALVWRESGQRIVWMVLLALFLTVFQGIRAHHHQPMSDGLEVFLALYIAGGIVAEAQTFRRLWDRCRKGRPAFVVAADGIEEYASPRMLGKLPWDDIEMMWVQSSAAHTWFPRRAGSRSAATVTGVYIQLKDDAYGKYVHATGRWQMAFKRAREPWKYVWIPEQALAVPAADMMLQLNAFYTEHVRKDSSRQRPSDDNAAP